MTKKNAFSDGTVVHRRDDGTEIHIGPDGVTIHKSEGHFVSTNRSQMPDDGSGIHIPDEIQKLQNGAGKADIIGLYTRHHNPMTKAQYAHYVKAQKEHWENGSFDETANWGGLA